MKAIELCQEINTELEVAEANDTPNDEVLERALTKFKVTLARNDAYWKEAAKTQINLSSVRPPPQSLSSSFQPF